MSATARLEAAVSLAFTDPDRPEHLHGVANQLGYAAESLLDGTAAGVIRAASLTGAAARVRNLAGEVAATAGPRPEHVRPRVLVTARDHVRAEVRQVLGALAVSVVLAEIPE